jgi:uncharacterized protein YgfB (UPF0149 family)
MSHTPILPTYSEISSILKKTPEKYNASQLHGLLCGLMCGTLGKDAQHWQTLTGHPIIQQLYETTYQQLSEFSFEFALLLPSDTKDINLRTESLGLWCQGFLAGLKQVHVRLTQREPGEITDALNDITEIAQVGFGDIKANSEEETAYCELVEYVRLAILMLFQELRSKENPGENDFLH